MAKFKTKGATLKFGASNPPTDAVGQLGDSTLDLGEREALVDITTHDNTSGTTDQLDVGFVAPPTLSGELLYDPADTEHEAMRAAHAAGTAEYALVTLPDAGAATILFPCIVASLGLPVPVKGKLSMTFTLKGTGAYTFTA